MDKKIDYNPTKIEADWQKYWEKEKTFNVDENPDKDKFYVLTEFPYPSGDGLHAGHLRPNTAMDIIARKNRMQNKNVLFPIGYDAFGLPTENFAIKKNIAPQIVTEKNIKNFERQFKSLGFSFDWSRSFSTTDEDYYRWTQWIFIKMYKEGLAYKAKENINWCISCKIGLANEEVVGGVCERCDSEVVKKEKEQWMLKITKYADRLIDDLDKVDFLERIKIQQKNWIGRSEGTEVDFAIEGSEEKLKVFTTRPDTLFGATFMVISPEHAIIHKLEENIKNIDEIKEYIVAAAKKSDIERASDDKDKTGVEIKGIKAINPANSKEMPVFVADYVLTSYGTGAIMAVPAHDPRDWDFAKKYNLEIRPVIWGGETIDKDEKAPAEGTIEDMYAPFIKNIIDNGAYTGNGKMIDADAYNLKRNTEVAEEITAWLEKNNIGKKTKNYRLRDWIFSRQRYWGEPIPMINCKKCGWVPVSEDELPVKLPITENFQPGDDGESPLKKITDWVNTTCPDCGDFAQRETDVMPNWAGSNWYFIRYGDPKNNKGLISEDKAKYWLPVDWYQGGMEHTTLHLLYSRFVYKFLFDIGAIPKECGDEPYKKRTAHGMILGKDGIKMSKSKGNIVNPDDYIRKYGADSVRTYIMFMGPFDQDVAMNDRGVVGIFRFLNKVWDYVNSVYIDESSKLLPPDKRQEWKDGVIKTSNKKIKTELHKTIKKVSDDIDSMNFNTAISQLMIFLNEAYKVEGDLKGGGMVSTNRILLSRQDLEDYVLLLAPFAPHMCEEIWKNLGHENNLSHEAWPAYDEKLAQDEAVTIGIQVNGKVRDDIELAIDTEASEKLQAEILAMPKIQKNIADKKVVKFIHIKNKIISIVVK